MATALPDPTVVDPDGQAVSDPRFTRLTPQLVGRTMWSLVALQLLGRALASGSGYLYWDDFILQSRASRLPFPSVELMFTPHDGHLMPGAMAVAWVVTRLAPLSPAAVTASLVLLQAISSAAVVLMLGRLFGRRPLVLVPLAVYLVSPLTLPSSLWWSAALNTLPLQAALALAVWGHVGFLRHRSRAGLGVALAATVVGLAFFEKAVIVPILLVGVTWVLQDDAGYTRSLRRALTGHWRLWTLYGALLASYVAVFSRAGRPESSTGSTVETARIVLKGIVGSFVPTAVGGPVRWSPVGYAAGYADPPAWLVVGAMQVAAVVVVWSVWAQPRARRAWTVLAGYLAGDLLVLALTRGGTAVSEQLALSSRYVADAAVVLTFVLGVALMPLVGEQPPPRVEATRAWLSRRPTALWTTTFVAADVFVVLSLVSSVAYVSLWSANPAREWVENARDTLAAAPEGVPILPDPVPVEVLYGIAYPENLTSYVLAPVQGSHVFGDRTSQLQTFDASGRLVPGAVDGASSVPPLEPGCWRVEDGRGLIRLNDRLRPWQYTVHLGYLSGGTTGGTVTLGAGRPSRIELMKGLHDEYVRVGGAGSNLYITTDDPDVTVCIDPAAVGGVVPDTTVEP